MRATKDAFEVLELIASKRLARRLTTVLDTTGLDPKRRAGWLAVAERHRVPAYAVVFDTPANSSARATARGRRRYRRRSSAGSWAPSSSSASNSQARASQASTRPVR